jgi:hypothetical protein
MKKSALLRVGIAAVLASGGVAVAAVPANAVTSATCSSTTFKLFDNVQTKYRCYTGTGTYDFKSTPLASGGYVAGSHGGAISTSVGGVIAFRSGSSLSWTNRAVYDFALNS